MKLLQRWKQTTIANQGLVITGVLIAVGTVCLAVAAVFQYRTAREQSKAAIEQARAATEQANVMRGQLNAIQDQANTMREQTNTMNDSLAETRKTANAAVTQANTSQKLVEQNRLAVNAAISQSKSAQASVGISQQTFTLLERPSLGIEAVEEPKLEAGKRPTARVAIKNFGHIPAYNSTVLASLFARPATDVSAPCPEPGKITEVIGLASRSVIAVNGVRYATAIGNGIVAPSDVTRINIDKSFWTYVYIRAEYGERSQYFLEYYARQNVDTKSWEECGTHNRAN